MTQRLLTLAMLAAIAAEFVLVLAFIVLAISLARANAYQIVLFVVTMVVIAGAVIYAPIWGNAHFNKGGRPIVALTVAWLPSLALLIGLSRWWLPMVFGPSLARLFGLGL